MIKQKRAIEPLSDAERGRIFTALMEYARSGEAPHLSGNERLLFPIMRAQIDRDQADYKSFCEKQSENGRKGGRPPKKPAEKALGSEKTPKSQDKDKGKEKDTPPKAPQGESASFLQFWELYPRKINRAAANRAWERLSPGEELTCRILSAVQEQSESPQWQQERGRYIPSPAKWLDDGRWEDRLPQADKRGGRSYDIGELEELAGLLLPEGM